MEDTAPYRFATDTACKVYFVRRGHGGHGAVPFLYSKFVDRPIASTPDRINARSHQRPIASTP
ncbi:hypothetical protein, partial [Microcoleus sp. herbarium2]|uniref:hypothetical protein n=1 Tax=Microcoleus sp. herbarium2 TaxID=3055433 RepID=UPI002FCE9DEC